MIINALKLILDNVIYILAIFLLCIFMIAFSYYMMLLNIADKTINEAEMTGNISSTFLSNKYNNSPLSKIDGEFIIISAVPQIDQKASGLGAVMELELQKTVSILPNLELTIKAKEKCVNLGYYGQGYQP